MRTCTRGGDVTPGPASSTTQKLVSCDNRSERTASIVTGSAPVTTSYQNIGTNFTPGWRPLSRMCLRWSGWHTTTLPRRAAQEALVDQ